MYRIKCGACLSSLHLSLHEPYPTHIVVNKITNTAPNKTGFEFDECKYNDAINNKTDPITLNVVMKPYCILFL